jgi:hypothetical protein
MYQIDWFKWLDYYVWDSVRKDKHVSWLKALITPIIRMHNSFLSYKQSVDFDLKVNSQTVKLKWGLNQLFDSALSRITIVDNANNQADFIFLASENAPLYLPNFLNSNEYEFEVQVPVSLIGFDAQIRAFLNTYKLPSKRYIVTYA